MRTCLRRKPTAHLCVDYACRYKYRRVKRKTVSQGRMKLAWIPHDDDQPTRPPITNGEQHTPLASSCKLINSILSVQERKIKGKWENKEIPGLVSAGEGPKSGLRLDTPFFLLLQCSSQCNRATERMPGAVARKERKEGADKDTRMTFKTSRRDSTSCELDSKRHFRRCVQPTAHHSMAFSRYSLSDLMSGKLNCLF